MAELPPSAAPVGTSPASAPKPLIPLEQRPSLSRPAEGWWLSWVVLIATSATFGVCFYRLQGVIGIDSPWSGLFLMGSFSGLAKFAEPLFRLRLPRDLRRVREWELAGTAYARLRVQSFGKLLRSSPLRHLNSSVFVKRTGRDLGRLRDQVESAEAIHFWAMVLLSPYNALTLAQGQWLAGALLGLVQVLFNVYPILHLRSVRGRLPPRSQP